MVKIVLGGAAGLGIGYLVVFWIQNRNPDDPKPKSPSQQPRQVIARAPDRNRSTHSNGLPEFRHESSPPVPAVPTFVPPVIGFGPPEAASSPPGSPFTPPPVASDTRPAGRKGKAKGKTAPPTQPSAPSRPLEGLATAIKLPALVDTAGAVLCPLHVPSGETLDIGLNAVAANIPAEAALLIERNSSNAIWQIAYAPDVSGAASDKRVLAELKHEGGQLHFTWQSPIEDAPARKELSNCLLRLNCGNASQTAFLRVAQEVPRVRIDLSRDIVQQTLAILDPPREDCLRLEFVELVGFPGGASLRDDKRLLKLKERAIIEFAQFPGAEIQIEFRRNPMGELQLVMRPEFRENAAEKMVMTIPRLADLKKGLEKSIPEGEAKLVALGKEAEAIDDQLRRLGPRPNGAAFVAWQSQRNRLESALSSARSQASRLSRRLPEMKLRLSVVPKMGQFLSELHRQGTLKVRIVAECGDARPAIVEAALDPPAPQQVES